jgi:acyl-CoA thioesterase FadM
MFSTGRHKALASLNMPVEQFQREGILMALSELALQYKAPLRAGDTFYVTTAVAQVSMPLLI